MPGRHQVIYAYRNYGGGTDLWCSDAWYPSGAWYYVWHSAKPLSLWHRTPWWAWRPLGWRFCPEAPWNQLTPNERVFSDINLPLAQATQWGPPIGGGAKGGGPNAGYAGGGFKGQGTRGARGRGGAKSGPKGGCAVGTTGKAGTAARVAGSLLRGPRGAAAAAAAAGRAATRLSARYRQITNL